MLLLLGLFRLLSLLLDLLVLVLVELDALHEDRLLLEVLLAECIRVSQGLRWARLGFWLWLWLWSWLLFRLWLRLGLWLLLRLWLWLWLRLVKPLILVNIELDALLEDDRVFILLAKRIRIPFLRLRGRWLLLLWLGLKHWWL